MQTGELLEQVNDFAFEGWEGLCTSVDADNSGVSKAGKEWSYRKLTFRGDDNRTVKLTWWYPNIHDPIQLANCRFYVQKGKVTRDTYQGNETVGFAVNGENLVPAFGDSSKPTIEIAEVAKSNGSSAQMTDIDLVNRMKVYAQLLKGSVPDENVSAMVNTVVISLQKGLCVPEPSDKEDDDIDIPF